MIIHDYPLHSTDLQPDSTTYSEYIEGLNKLFGSLVSTTNVLLLEPLFPILKEKNHLHIARIDQELELFVKNTSDDKAKLAFDVCFRCVANAINRRKKQKCT